MSWEFYTQEGTRKVQSETALVGDADTLDGFNSTAFVFKSGDTMAGPLTLSGAPSSNLHAATKLYVDTTAAAAAAGAATGAVSDTGDTMTGSLIMSGAGVQITLPNAPVAPTDAANKTYVDTNFLALTGGTMSGDITLTGSADLMLGNSSTIAWSDVSISRGGIGGYIELSSGDQIRVLQDPVHGNDLARKSYVDLAGGGGSTTLDGLTDVVLTPPSVGEILTFDGVTWGNYLPIPAPDTLLDVTTATHTATLDFTTLLCDTSSTAITITLPDIVDIPEGTRYTIKDASGNSAVNNVTVQGTGGEAIDGIMTYVLDNPYEFVTLVYQGTMWFVVG